MVYNILVLNKIIQSISKYLRSILKNSIETYNIITFFNST